MGRTAQFDREQVVAKAMMAFWRHGYAGTSTEVLLGEMGIGRQSLYHAFGDKRALYLEALNAYQEQSVATHVARLEEPESPLEGIRALLAGVVPEDDELRSLGCFGVNSIEEFGTSDPEVVRITDRANAVLERHVTERVEEARRRGEVEPDLDVVCAVQAVLLAMTGLQVSARGGTDMASIDRAANFAARQLAVR